MATVAREPSRERSARGTFGLFSTRRARSQHVLIICEKTCWLPNALSVVGVCSHPSLGRKSRSPERDPKPAQLGDSRTYSKRRVPRHPVKMAQKNSAGGDCITPTTLCQGSYSPNS